ncbi:ferredoxin reductase family protein [Aromatoleum aromaticum]|uniref:ferredoxin reductase family protein n=1 Tax=Aromatoleum aromaticum TaxID=551760 RepID=UPI001459F768|nr:ferric reductase-like transmembrane domain-containing protein [Aromatoleum aromaticum]NMG53818.1 ferric reductase [Aromatoleum aromaticum]
MIPTLTALIAIVAGAWGWDLAVNGAGSGSVPWVVYEQGLYLSGLLAIAMMSLAMVMATRPPGVERLLGGMDRAYRLHKWAGILAAGFASLHWLLEMSDDVIEERYGEAGRGSDENVSGVLDTLRDAGEELGEFAIYLVLAMIVLALWKRFPYKFWRHIHRAMPVLYLMLAFHAAVLAPTAYWSEPTGLLLAGALSAGTLAAVWSLTGRIGRGRQAHGVVTAVASPAPDVTEVVCRLDGNWRGHHAGQFAFVTFNRIEGAHPFTIASADQGDRSVRFQIKALGDYTRELSRRIAVGQAVTVEGPYGRFELARQDRKARQIWVAGGIGITPFLAWLDALRASPAAAPVADLHYCTRAGAADPFVGRLETLCRDLPSVTLHVHDTARHGALTAERLATLHDCRQRAEVWFCGPRAFAEQLRSGLARAWLGRLRFHQEAFDMR